MPIRVELINETGEVERSANGCGGLLGRVAGDEGSRVVRYIDPFGDTYFNRVQMPDFLADWEERYPRAGPNEDEGCWLEVKALAEECIRQPHLYLRFVGD